MKETARYFCGMQLHALSVAARLMALAVPLVFAGGAVFARRKQPMRGSIFAAAAAVILACGHAAACAASATLARDALAPFVRTDGITAVVLLLIAGLGFVVARYSRAYLAGEPGLQRYERALGAALGGAALVVVSNHLLVLALAWTGTSLALHVLLTFYRGRPRAVAAAHEKFVLARVADVLVLGAVLVIHRATGTLEIDRIVDAVTASGELSLPLHVAAVLIAAAVCVKSAQLPFHGWLMRVMEAPTPVSALMHAGVVNIGGFVLLRLAPLVTMAPFARGLLVVVGTTSAVLGALVMATRPTVKASLAWSTSAQLGFMLVECGLGAWHLALLHLLAHSAYKAHAFLTSGGAVERWRLGAMAQRVSVGSVATKTLVVALGLVACVGAGAFAPNDVALGVAFLVLSLLPAALRAVESSRRPLAAVAPQLLVLVASYAVWRAALAGLVAEDAPALFGIVFAGAGFTLLATVQIVIELWPRSSVARRTHRWLFAEVYLDHLFTRLAHRLWPLQGSTRPASTATRVEA